AGSDVIFIARGAHLEALRTKGLRLESPKGNLHLPRVTATDDPAAVGPVDVVLFTVKLYDTESATRLLPPLIGPNTVVVSLQNGVDSVEILAGAVGRPHVAGGVAYVAAVISEPGTIRHTAMDQLIFGELDGTKTPRLEALLDACRAAGFQATLSDRIDVDIWSKFVRLSAFSGMTAVTRAPIGPLRDDPDLFAMIQAAYLEGMAVAHKKGDHDDASDAAAAVEIVDARRSRARQAARAAVAERGRRADRPRARRRDADSPVHRDGAQAARQRRSSVGSAFRRTVTGSAPDAERRALSRNDRSQID
ncbi:MAG: hypothetical protein DMF91_26940, partial [Acidobacteria bacterium]